MTEVTEIFILKMKDGAHIDAVRETARSDFTGLEGVTSWETFVTTDHSRPTLYADVFKFPDADTAKRVTGQFSERPATQAFLSEIDEILVGQFFKPHQPNLQET